MFRTLFSRWFSPAADSRGRVEAILYFNGPLTKWERSANDNHFEEHPGGLRIPLPDVYDELMSPPHVDEVIQRRQFRFEFAARIWVLARLKGFDHSKVVGEVRPVKDSGGPPWRVPDRAKS